MRSIIQEDRDFCFLCGRKATDEHHILGGRNRGKSEEHGLKCYLCRQCHTGIHNADNDSQYKDGELWLKVVAQRRFEEKYSHELWMKEFGRNYLL